MLAQESFLKIRKIAFVFLAVVAGLTLIFVIFYSFAGYFGVSVNSPTAPTSREGQTVAPNFLGTGEYVEKTDTAGPSQAISEDQPTERKMIKTGSLELLVKSADKTAKDIQGIAEQMDGFVSASNVYEVSTGTKTGSVTIRIPAARFSEALDEVKKLAIKVEHESVNAQDVTEQYTDLESRLRNLQATEQQYLTILKQAVKIPDILQVTAQLDQVRMQIEQIQGQLKYLSGQVDMASITASLTEEAEVEVFGLRWRPLYVVKLAFRGMLNGLSGYVDAMIKFILQLPVILAWLITIGLIIFICWKILRWIWQRFLKPPIAN